MPQNKPKCTKVCVCTCTRIQWSKSLWIHDTHWILYIQK